MLEYKSDNPEDLVKEEIFPIIKRRQIGDGRFVLKMMNCNLQHTDFAERFHPKFLNVSDIDKRCLDFNPQEINHYPPQYIYGFSQDVGSILNTLCVFEYTTIPPKLTKTLQISSDAQYLGVLNQNPSQEIVINICQDHQRPPTKIRILVGKVDPMQKKMKFVKMYISDLAKNSLVFNGGDHLLVIDSETPNAITMSKIGLIPRCLS